MKAATALTPSRHTLLKHKLHLRERKDGRFEIKPIDEVFSFDKGFFLFIRAVQVSRPPY